jgi:hypothetical protein
MIYVKLAAVFLSLSVMLSIGPAVAQAPPPPYGAPISLDLAKKAMAGAEAEARKNSWNVVNGRPTSSSVSPSLIPAVTS